MRRPTIEPTTWRGLAVAFMAGLAIAGLGAQALTFAGIALPQPGIGAWLPALLLASATGWWAWTTHVMVSRRPLDLDAAAAVGRLRWAQAGMLVAAFMTGMYAAFMMSALRGWPAPAAEGRVVHGVLAVIASIGWGIASWLLERSCRIPDDDEDQPGSSNHPHP